MPRKYKITNAGNQSDSPDLVDCYIEEKKDGDGYELVAKRLVLATTNSTTPPFTFSFNNYEGWNWNVTVDAISPSQMSGVWNNTDNPEAEGDSWTAAGTTTGDPGDDEARAASAK
jgi:hypothetical protein